MLARRNDIEFARFVADLLTELMSHHEKEFARTQVGKTVDGYETARLALLQCCELQEAALSLQFAEEPSPVTWCCLSNILDGLGVKRP